MLEDSQITQNLFLIREKIHHTALTYHRDPNHIQLLVVTKTQNIDQIEILIHEKQTHFGENYIKEALPKIEALKKYPLTWHFIGPIQSNKTKDIAMYFDWVHSIDREKIAKRLNDQRAPSQKPLNICIEVNLAEEKTKSGILLNALPHFAQALQKFPQLHLRGLMAMPPLTNDITLQRHHFKQLRLAFEELQGLGYDLDTLSMGTSHDYSAAIAEGATCLRIGSCIFGNRI